MTKAKLQTAITAEQVLEAAGRAADAATSAEKEQHKVAPMLREYLEQKGSDPLTQEVAYKQLLEMARTVNGEVVGRRELPIWEGKRYSALTTARSEMTKKENKGARERIEKPTKYGKTLARWVADAQKSENQDGLNAVQLASLIAASRNFPVPKKMKVK
jgi:hypothetical protein